MIRWRVVNWKTRYWDVTEEGIDQKGHTESLVYNINRIGYWEFINKAGFKGISYHQKVYFIR